MANSLLTIDMITNESLAVLENELTFTKYVNREYDDQFANQGAQIGDTLNIRKPVRYVTRRGQALQVQNSVESSVPVTLTQAGCDISFSTKDMTLSIAEFSTRFIEPQLASVANTIDFDGLQQYKNVYQTVGTAGTTPATLLTYLDANVKLDNSAAPKGDAIRSAIVNPQANATLVNALTNTFNPTSEISSQYINGNMGRAVGLKFSMDQNVAVQTFGIQTGNPLVQTAPVTGATTIAVTGMTASTDTVNVGDVFTISNVFTVNPQSRTTTGQLQQFVVTTANTADSSGNMTIAFSPAIVFNPGSQQNQNVDSLPVVNAALTFAGSSGSISAQNLVFCRDAFTLASADLMMPGGVDMAARKRSKSLNMSMRAVRAYDINNDRLPMRIDVLYGWATMRPELAVRVLG